MYSKFTGTDTIFLILNCPSKLKLYWIDSTLPITFQGADYTSDYLQVRLYESFLCYYSFNRVKFMPYVIRSSCEDD